MTWQDNDCQTTEISRVAAARESSQVLLLSSVELQVQANGIPVYVKLVQSDEGCLVRFVVVIKLQTTVTGGAVFLCIDIRSPVQPSDSLSSHHD